MKRGVPPTALKARTGEFTPPGMTRWARSNSWALRDMSVDVAGRGRRGVVERGLAGLAAFGQRLAIDPGVARGQGPEEAVGHDVAHAGSEARVQRLVEEAQGFGHRHVELGAAGEDGRQRRRQGVACAHEAGLETLEALA